MDREWHHDGSLRDARRALACRDDHRGALLVLVAASAFVVTNQVAARARARGNAGVAHFSEGAGPDPGPRGCARQCTGMCSTRRWTPSSCRPVVVPSPWACRHTPRRAPRTDRHRPDRRSLALVVIAMCSSSSWAWRSWPGWSHRCGRRPSPRPAGGPVARRSSIDLAVTPLSSAGARSPRLRGRAAGRSAAPPRDPAYAVAAAVLSVVVASARRASTRSSPSETQCGRSRCGPYASDDCQDPDWLYYLSTGFRDADGTILAPDRGAGDHARALPGLRAGRHLNLPEPRGARSHRPARALRRVRVRPRRSPGRRSACPASC